jgi:proteasome alpha subunit
MSMPFYVSPEQLMKDRADFARKGIARGKSLVVVQYADGLLFVAENQSQVLHKISELYDRLAFAAVGRYNEFENLRIAGVRLADMRGYSYDRRDVTGRALANAYAQTLGTVFSAGGEKPYEVELFVAEVSDEPAQDQVYRLTYHGSVADEHQYAVMGGSAEEVSAYLRDNYQEGLELEAALRLAVDALAHDTTPTRRITGDQLEAAVLDRTRSQPRKFRRIRKKELTDLFGSVEDDPTTPVPAAPADDARDPAEDSSANGAGSASTPASESEPVNGSNDPSDAVGDPPDDPSDSVGDLPDEPRPTRDE